MYILIIICNIRVQNVQQIFETVTPGEVLQLLDSILLHLLVANFVCGLVLVR